MNVVMIGPFGLRPKGTMRFRALSMAKTLVARGYDVTVLIPSWDSPADSGCEWEEDRVKIVSLNLPPRWPILFHILLVYRLVDRALTLDPDIIHFFKPKAYAGLAHFVLWWLRQLRLLKSVRLRSLRLVVDEDDWEMAWNVVAPYSRIQKRFFEWQERWGLTHADRVIVASRPLVVLVQELGVSSDRIVYVPNGIRLSSGQIMSPGVHPERAGDLAAARQIVRMLWELDDALSVLLYSRFLEFRLERVVGILRLIVTREPRAKLFIVGEGIFGEESELDELIQEARLSDYVVFTGWVEADRLPGYFAASDVAIFPYDDTLINRTKCSAKLIDLLAAGLPVVADDVGQNREYIVNGESGLLVTPGDDGAFANAVLRLLADPDLRSKLGGGAARRMQEYFAWDTLIHKVEMAYQ